MFKNLSNSLTASILSSFYRSSSHEFDIIFKNGVFSLGIIWSSLKQLIIIGGISFVFSVGLKGTGLQIEYLFFNLLLWFLFAEITNTTISLPFNKAMLSMEYSNAYTYIFGHIIRIIIQYFLLLCLSLLLFFIFDIDIYLVELIRAFILMIFVSIIYSTFIAAIFHKKTFLIEMHGFYMQALFFASATVIPINLIPQPIRDFLLVNPIVHIQESYKSNVTGLELSYISDSNPIIFIFFGIFLILPSIQFKDNRFQEELDLD